MNILLWCISRFIYIIGIWNKMFITGIDKIDAQHKNLFELILKLKRDMKESENKNIEVHNILVSLVKYVKIHFTYEESYLEKIKYSKIDEHKIIHRKFILELKKIIAKYKETGTYDENYLFIFLLEWLQTHIAVEDQKYVKKINFVIIILHSIW